jgi:hypothetical protein
MVRRRQVQLPQELAAAPRLVLQRLTLTPRVLPWPASYGRLPGLPGCSAGILGRARPARLRSARQREQRPLQ